MTLPLWATPGYELALLMSLALAPFAPSYGVRIARGRARVTTLALMGLSAVGYIALTSLCGLGCNAWRALGFFVLLPGIGSAWGAALGYWVAVAWPRRARAVAAVLPWLMLVRVALRFLFTPSIKFYEPLWGYFSGSLYDELIDVTLDLWLWRLGSLTEIFAMLALAAWLRHNAWRTARSFALVALFLSVSLIEIACALAPVPAQLARHLPRTIARPGIVVHLPESVAPKLAQQIADDHAYRIATLCERMQLALPTPPFDSWVFADAADKARWMGGRNTMVSKPWRHEIYVHGLEAPHALVPHELVHALASLWSDSYLGVPARFGLFVDMGLVEGVAVALAPDRSALGVLGEARALLDLGLLLPSSQLMGSSPQSGMLNFWRQPAARAYGQSGALLRFVAEEHGMAALRALYGGAALRDITHRDSAELDRAFAQRLARLDLPPGATELVRGALSQQSIFVRRCPHEVARLRSQATTAATPAAAAYLWRQAQQASGGESGDALGEAVALRAAHQEPQAEALERALVAQGRVDFAQEAELHVLWALAAARRGEREQLRAELHRPLRYALPLPAVRAALWLLWASREDARILGAVVDILSQGAPAQMAHTVAQLRDDVRAKRIASPDFAHADTVLAGIEARLQYRAHEPRRALDVLLRSGPQPDGPLDEERERLLAVLALECGERATARAALTALQTSSPWPGTTAWAEDMRARLDYDETLKR